MTKLLIATAAALVIGAAITASAQAGIVGPSSTVKNASQAIELTEKTRRICRTQLSCTRFPCRFVQQCYVTSDYPPENGNRR